MAHELLGVPVQHHDQVNPARAPRHHLGHVDAPPLIGPARAGLGAARRPLGLEPDVSLHAQGMDPHQTQDPLLVHREPVHIP